MRIVPGKPRYEISNKASSLAFSISARRSWLDVAILICWLGLWTIWGVPALHQEMQSSDDRALLAAMMAGWVLGEVMAAVSLLWQLAGREEFRISGQDFSHSLRIGRLERSRKFTNPAISRLRLSPPHTSRERRAIFRPGAITFDHGTRTYRIGIDLDRAEARLILKEVAQRYPDLVWNASASEFEHSSISN